MSDIKITGVRAIETAPQPGNNLVIVRIDTNQPGLYGYGCATYTQRHAAVVTAINTYMSQLLVGRDALDIEDAYMSAVHSSYWRNGPVLNNAISGCDMALWDILGKVANLPVYRLLGGKVRAAVPLYHHAAGRDMQEMEDSCRRYLEEGYQYLRVRVSNYGTKERYIKSPEGSADGFYFDSEYYARTVPKMFEHLRVQLGEDVGLMHDVHARVLPRTAVRLAKELEPYRLYFLEDALAPEQAHYFKQLREASSVPLAMGELFNNPMEWKLLVENRWIDYIRCHVSQIGGITPAKHISSFCANFDVRTAWHGPGDVSPIGHAANLHLDISTSNFGIQEWCCSTDDPRLNEVFPVVPYTVKNGYAYLSDRPGLGVEVDEEAAKKYPCDTAQPRWLLARWPDGTSANG